MTNHNEQSNSSDLIAEAKTVADNARTTFGSGSSGPIVTQQNLTHSHQVWRYKRSSWV